MLTFDYQTHDIWYASETWIECEKINYEQNNIS